MYEQGGWGIWIEREKEIKEQRKRKRDIEIEREKEIERQRMRERQTDRQTERENERNRDTDKHIVRQREIPFLKKNQLFDIIKRS